MFIIILETYKIIKFKIILIIIIYYIKFENKKTTLQVSKLKYKQLSI